MLRFMKNKILIPLLIAGALATFFSFSYSNADTTDDERRALVLKTVVKAINEGHYSARKVDDSLSNMVYNKVMAWDYEKKLKKGDNLILAAFGGGFTWGAVWVKWAYNSN